MDEHLVEPERSRDEIVRGRRVYAAPSLPEHGDPHFRLDVALGTHLKPGWVGSTDLLTRVANDGDFATDTCVRREGIDPTTGRRYLEELSFEVVNTQRLSDVTAKAEDLVERGVRRVFAIFTRKGVVSEWRDGDWEPIDDDGTIEDACLAAPLPVEALLRASALGAVAVRGLLARGEPELTRLLERSRSEGREKGLTEGREKGLTEGREKGLSEGLTEGRTEGRVEGAMIARREVLRLLCAQRGIALGSEEQARIDACAEGAVLDRWITRAAAVATAGEVFA